MEGDGEADLELVGAPKTVEFWAVNNSCSLKADDDGVIVKKTTFASPDVTCEQFRACKDGASVELCTVWDGGHNWPGAMYDLCEVVGGPEQDWFTCWWWGKMTREIAAHEVIWDFVKNYRLPEAAE